jgi:hypothetical protein
VKCRIYGGGPFKSYYNITLNLSLSFWSVVPLGQITNLTFIQITKKL